MARRRTAVSKGARLKQPEEPPAMRPERAGGRLPSFRNRRGEQVEPRSFSASDAKNQFGRVLETALGTFFLLSARKAANFKAALPYHEKVYEAVRKRQPELARQAMLSMVAESRNNIRGRGRRTKSA